MNKKYKNKATPVQIHNHVGFMQHIKPEDFINHYAPLNIFTGVEGLRQITFAISDSMKESMNQMEFNHLKDFLPKNLRFRYQRDKKERYLVSRDLYTSQVYKILYDEKKTKYSCEFTLLINNKLFLTTSNLDEIKDYINEAYDNSRK